MRNESKTLEFKSVVSKTYLKTVSAFANYGDGEIVFDVDDEGVSLGIKNSKQVCLDIENQINDSIKPKPDFALNVNGDNTISLFVKQGYSTPYRFNGKAYKRNDTSTVEVDEVEEKRLILQGMNLAYEELPAKEGNLNFSYLGSELRKVLDLSVFGTDTLKSLGLLNSKGQYNVASELLADENDFPGLDVAVFASSANVFKKRFDCAGESVLKQYRDALNAFQEEYVVERIEGGFREKKELIPFEAFREAVANALVHRAWDIKANTKIEMHPDRIVISSPGGLMPGMTKEDYERGNYSSLRNPILANVFHRLKIIEAFATGIRRINESYKNSIVKPIYDVTGGAISVTLPVVNKLSLSPNEERIFAFMAPDVFYSRMEIEVGTGIAKDSLIRGLNALIQKGVLEKRGQAKATLYIKRSL